MYLKVGHSSNFLYQGLAEKYSFRYFSELKNPGGHAALLRPPRDISKHPITKRMHQFSVVPNLN